jgi:hypothetical protein
VVRMKTAIALLLMAALGAIGQSFNSGSTGADGALSLTSPGLVEFDPKTIRPNPKPGEENVYHFTSIYIAAGVTVKLSGKALRSPVFWLSQGPVQIDGKLDLDGADGDRLPSTPGAGGYSGGATGKAATDWEQLIGPTSS